MNAEHPYKGKSGLKRLLQATRNSYDGLRHALRHESAVREELLLACVLIPLALVLKTGAVERVLMIGSVLLLLIVELLNTSVEAAIDRIGLERHDLSKLAKDLGSAAVGVTLLLLVTTWGLLLFS
jgi:diacylglycerol kinase (ATP)